MKATRLLIEEHQYILQAIRVIDEMADGVASGVLPDDRDLEAILEFLQFFGDGHHQEKEESILFPALLNSSCPEAHGRLCRITFEHNQQRSLLEGIEDALKTHRKHDFLYYAKRLGELVRAHIRCEEEEIFRDAEAMLSLEEDERVARELAAYGSPLQSGKLERLLEQLLVMESKYGAGPNAASQPMKKAHYA